MRKYALPVILMFMSIVNSNGQEKRPTWETQLAHKEGQVELKQLPVIKPKLSVDGKIAEVSVINNTDITLSYSGYNTHAPIVYKKVLVEGEWQAGLTGFCGTGLKKLTLKPGEKMTVKIHVPKIAVQNFMLFKNAENPDEYSVVKLFESTQASN